MSWINKIYLLFIYMCSMENKPQNKLHKTHFNLLKHSKVFWNMKQNNVTGVKFLKIFSILYQAVARNSRT